MLLRDPAREAWAPAGGVEVKGAGKARGVLGWGAKNKKTVKKLRKDFTEGHGQ